MPNILKFLVFGLVSCMSVALPASELVGLLPDQGGFSETYFIRNKKSGLIAVLKRPKKTKQAQDDFQREVAILAAVQHKNIVKLINADLEEMAMILVYCEKGELFRLLDSQRLTFNQAINFFTQIMNGIEYIHLKKYAHCDIKPENILLTKNDEIKICDFGLARKIPDESTLNPDTRCTIAWSPLEVFHPEKEFFYQRDIWSAGALLFTLLFGVSHMSIPNVGAFFLLSRDEKIAVFHKAYKSSIELARLKLEEDGIDKESIEDVIDFLEKALATDEGTEKKRLGCGGPRPNWEEIRKHIPQCRPLEKNRPKIEEVKD